MRLFFKVLARNAVITWMLLALGWLLLVCPLLLLLCSYVFQFPYLDGIDSWGYWTPATITTIIFAFAGTSSLHPGCFDS